MRFRRLCSGVLFVLGVYLFGLHLTTADGSGSLTNHLLFVLFGRTEQVALACEDATGMLPCGPGQLTRPNGAVEIVDLATTPPTIKKAIDLGAAEPTSLAVAPDGKRFYVVDSYNRNVYTVDSATGGFLATVFVPEVPLDCILSPDGAILYVTTAVPSVVAINTASAFVAGQVTPLQPWPEKFGGISFAQAITGGQLAVATTSGGPAMYFINVLGGAMNVSARVEVSDYCTDVLCPRGDDAVFMHPGRALLTNLNCRQLHQFVAGLAPQRILNSTVNYAPPACLPLNPRNSTVFSQASQKAYIVHRSIVAGLQWTMAIVDPVSLWSGPISGFAGVPEAEALTPDGRSLYIIKQKALGQSLKLDTFDTLGSHYISDVYTFSSLTRRRAAIDARIVQAPGVFTLAANPFGRSWPEGWLGRLAQLALLAFGVVLWRRDRR